MPHVLPPGAYLLRGRAGGVERGRGDIDSAQRLDQCHIREELRTMQLPLDAQGRQLVLLDQRQCLRIVQTFLVADQAGLVGAVVVFDAFILFDTGAVVLLQVAHGILCFLNRDQNGLLVVGHRAGVARFGETIIRADTSAVEHGLGRGQTNRPNERRGVE